MPSQDSHSCSYGRRNILFFITLTIFITTQYAANGQDLEFDLEPSLNILNNFESTKNKKENGGSWGGTRQSVFYQIQVGKLFNKSITDIAIEYGLSTDERYTAQIHIMGSSKNWLTYSEETLMLQGVPTNEDVGDVTILTVLKRKFNDLTIPIKLSVVKEAIFFDEFEVQCAVNDPKTVMSLSIDSEEEFDKLSTVSLILKLSSYFKQNPSKFLINYYADSLPDDRVFLSGRGNAESSSSQNKIVVSWNVGCGSDEDVPGLELLEISSQDGRLEQWIGHSVSEWKVLNRVSHQNLRLKRALQDDGTTQENSRLKSERITPGEETVDLKTRGRTRVQLNLIRNTPIVKPPVMATKLMTHQVIKPTPTAVATPIARPTKTPAPMKQNQPPMAVFDILDIEPRISCYFEFLIPGDTFYDREDGNAKNLKLQLFNSSSQLLIEEELSWPRFDMDEQMLYGVPPPNTPTQNTKMLLMATDKEGTSTTTEFNLKVNDDDKARARNHRYTFYLTETEKNVPADVFLSEFGRKLAIALAKTDNNPGSLMMLKSGYGKNGQRYVIWYDERLNSERLCYQDELLEVGLLMVGEDGMQGKNKPEKVFAGKFRPEYKLRSIKIEYIGPCDRKTTTMPPQTTEPIETTSEEAITDLLYDDDEYTEMPPVITPPPMMKTTTEQQTTPKQTTTPPPPPMPGPPTLTGKSVPTITTQVGKATIFTIPTGIFKDLFTPEADLELHLAPYKDNGLPAWVEHQPANRKLLLLPTLNDYSSLVKVNDTYSSWMCGLIAKNKENQISETLPLKIFVMKDQKMAMDYNHEFEITIANYDVKDFSVEKIWMLVVLLADVFGGHTDDIFVHPIKQGSVIFSWHNASLGNREKCPTEEITKLSQQIFTEDTKFTDSVSEKFADAGLEVTTGRLTKKGSCKTIYKPPMMTPPEVPQTPKMEETTAAVDVKAGSVGNGSAVIIIAVVVVCLLLLVVILVVKCKMAAKRKKKKNMNNIALQESPANAQSTKIKKGVPIIFQEELNGGKNGEAPSDGTPLLNTTADSPAYKNNNDHTIIGDGIETTPFNQSGVTATPITAKRTPPPYHPR